MGKPRDKPVGETLAKENRWGTQMPRRFQSPSKKRAVAISVVHKDRSKAAITGSSARAIASLIALLIAALLFHLLAQTSFGHIVPPEKLHPVAEAYRRANFILRLNPVVWDQVRPDVATIAEYWKKLDSKAGDEFASKVEKLIAAAEADPESEDYLHRKVAAARVFSLMTQAVSKLTAAHLKLADRDFKKHREALKQIQLAQSVWASFEIAVKASDPESYRQIGQAWLIMSSSLGNPGLLNLGSVEPNRKAFDMAAGKVIAYMQANFGPSFKPLPNRRLAPWPSKSSTFNAMAKLPIRLPPGSNINKQIPRPRQILNMVVRGVDESETPLIALGDMAFDSAYIFGNPIRSLGMSCNTCHNKGVTNPNFFIPGLSKRPGGMDVSNSHFAPHANNGHFDSLDIPDLRGIKFTAPYGRNGRFTSLREFLRNGIVNEFNGAEPDPMILDAMIAYMNEFDFLPNPYLKKDGMLSAKASKSAMRGQKIFHKPFKQMSGNSCATCHIPSSHFLDRRSHNIGSTMGAEPHSIDAALDTPTLLGIKHTPPYFHDGSQPTLRSVNEWFNDRFKLELSKKDLDDLTAYVETVGDGTDAYEDTKYYLDAEMEEFSFFLSAFEFLETKNKPQLMGITFNTIASEIRNHKWELRDWAAMGVMDRLAELMDEAYEANEAGDHKTVVKKVAEYRKLYEKNVSRLK
jgi:cytochrome c peroxidase